MSVKSHFAADALASVVVFLVALPLCMGIAIASGVPPALGLITGVIGGIVVGFLAGSPLQVSGPAAGLTVIVYELIQKHGIEMLGPAVALAGVLQLIAGSVKIGRWFRAISPAVIFGMLAGIGILIFASQFHVMVDDKPRGNGLANLLSIPQSFVKGFTPDQGLPHNEAAFIGVATIATLVIWGKYKPASMRLVPGALVAIVLATFTTWLLQFPIQRVDVPSNLLSAVRLPMLERLPAMLSPEFLMAAVGLAFVASAETLLSASAVDRMHQGPRTNYDRELSAQGVGNMICGVLGSLPMTGVIVRSSANVQAGAQTRASAILHGVWLLAFVSALPFVLRNVPVAALAAILVYTGLKLVDWKSFAQIRQYGRMPVAIYLATVAGIVAVDLLTGVLIGIGLCVVKLLYKVTHFHADFRLDPVRRRGELHIEGLATFFALPRLSAILDGVPAGTEVHVQATRLVYIDHSCLDLFRSWAEQNAGSGSALVVEWDGLMGRHRRPVAPSTDVATTSQG